MAKNGNAIPFMVKNGNAFAGCSPQIWQPFQSIPFFKKAAFLLPSVTIYYHNGISILKQPCLIYYSIVILSNENASCF